MDERGPSSAPGPAPLAARLDALAHDRRAWIAGLALALVARVAAVVLFGDRALEYEFATIVQHLLAGHGYAYWSVLPSGALSEAFDPAAVQVLPSAYMPPGYPLLLWPLAALFGTGPAGIAAAQAVQVALGVATVALVGRLGRRLFDARVGFVALVLAAVFPVLVFTAGQISAAALTVFLLVLFFDRALRAVDTGRPRDALVAGLVLGANVLVRSEFVLMAPVLLGWMAWRGGTRARRSVALAVFAAALVVAPWMLRNARTLGTATPTALSGGFNLWQGQGPGASGTHTGYTLDRVTEPGLVRAVDALPRTRTYEADRDAVFRRYALAQMQRDPLGVVRLAAKKAWLLWGHFGGARIHYPGAASPLFWAPWLVVLPFFLLGLWHDGRLAGPLGRDRAVLWLYLLVQTAITMGFFVLPRYRVFLLPAVLLFAASGIVRLASRRGPTPSPER